MFLCQFQFVSEIKTAKIASTFLLEIIMCSFASQILNVYLSACVFAFFFFYVCINTHSHIYARISSTTDYAFRIHMCVTWSRNEREREREIRKYVFVSERESWKGKS